MDGGKFLAQLVKIVFGYIAALLAAAGFLAWGFFRPEHPAEDPVMFAAMIGSGLVAASVIGAASVVPAGICILICELARLRGLVIYLAAGGGIAFLVWTLSGEPGAHEVRPGSVVVLAAGFCAGAAYWLVAGRSAGTWRPFETDAERTD